MAMNFHQNIPYSYLVMARTNIVCIKTNQRAVTQKLRKGDQPCILYVTRRCDLVYIAMKFHDYLVLVCTRIVYAGWTDSWTMP